MEIRSGDAPVFPILRSVTLLALLIVVGLLMASAAANAACSVTYTFSNGTTADATQVNTNFADVAACAGASSLWTVSGSNLVPTSTSYNVGIGTTSAGAKLYVDGNIYATGSISCGGTCGSGGSSGTIFSGTTGQIPYYAFNGNTVTATSSIFISGGNVGIGTTSPSALFSVGASSPFQISGSGMITATGFGVHFLLGAGTGEQVVITGNTASGSGNYGGYRIRNDNHTNLVTLLGLSSNHNPSGQYFASGGVLEAQGSGGLSIAVTQPSAALRFYTGGTPSERLRIDPSGNIGIGTASPGYLLTVNGTAYASGAAGALSDIRHKMSIAEIRDDVLPRVMKLRPVSYRWKKPTDDGMRGRQIGFIAQEVEKLFPDSILTQRNPEQTKGLKYNELVPILTKALQEQQNEIRALRATNDNQSAKLVRLQDQVGAQAAGLERLRAEMATLVRNANLNSHRKVVTLEGRSQ